MSLTNNYRPIWVRTKRRNQIREKAILSITRVRNKVQHDTLVLVYPKRVMLTGIKNNASKNITIYIYTKLYSTLFCIDTRNVYKIRFYPDANALQVMFNSRLPFSSLGFAYLYRFTKMFYSLFMQRMRVRGRLYRIYKRNIYKDMFYRFGHTHRMVVFVEGLRVKYIRKKKIRLFGYDYKYLVDKCKEIRDVFPLNIYTRRGIRIGGERTYTRIGKTVKYY